MFIVYHTHISATDKGRKMNIDRLYIDDSLKIKILGPTRTPQLMPSSIVNTLVNVDSVVLNNHVDSVLAGNTIQLTYDVSPDTATIKDVTWISTDNIVSNFINLV